jgi:hypothetical protein
VSLPAEVLSLIEHYKSGAEEIRGLVHGLTDKELDTQHPDGWSARMIVHHLADSEIQSAIRLRRLLAEPLGSTIQGYDEAAWAMSPVLAYQRSSITTSLQVLHSIRSATAELLDRLSVEDLDRYGFHTESGRYTVMDWLRIYTAHAIEHSDQIRRALLGQP